QLREPRRERGGALAREIGALHAARRRIAPRERFPGDEVPPRARELSVLLFAIGEVERHADASLEGEALGELALRGSAVASVVETDALFEERLRARGARGRLRPCRGGRRGPCGEQTTSEPVERTRDPAHA